MFVKVFFFPTPLLRYKLLVETILYVVGKCVVTYEHPVLTPLILSDLTVLFQTRNIAKSVWICCIFVLYFKRKLHKFKVIVKLDILVPVIYFIHKYCIISLIL